MSSLPRFNRPQGVRYLTTPTTDKSTASVGLGAPLPVPEVTYVSWSEWILATAPFALGRIKASPAGQWTRVDA